MKQTHDIKLAESFSPITKKVDEVRDANQTLGEVFKKPEVEDRNSQTPAIQKK